MESFPTRLIPGTRSRFSLVSLFRDFTETEKYYNQLISINNYTNKVHHNSLTTSPHPGLGRVSHSVRIPGPEHTSPMRGQTGIGGFEKAVPARNHTKISDPIVYNRIFRKPRNRQGTHP